MINDFILVLGSIAAVVTALTALAKFGPSRWLFNRLVTQPATEWLHGGVHTVVDPIRKENKADHEIVLGRINSIDRKVDQVDEKVEVLSGRLDNAASVLDETLDIEV